MADKILLRTGLESDAGNLDLREPGFTSDTKRMVVGIGSSESKFMTTEEAQTIAVAAPAAIAQLQRGFTEIICDTDSAAADIALDLTNGALNVPSIVIISTLGATATRKTVVQYQTGVYLNIYVNNSVLFIWTGLKWRILEARKFYEPIATDLSYGTYHEYVRATPGAYDKTVTTDTLASPGTWDLSAILPVGTSAIVVFANISYTTTSEIATYNFNAWDFDFGAHNAYNSLTRGMVLSLPGGAATVSAQARVVSGQFMIKIGSSRKIYYGLSATNPTGNLMLRGYYIK